MLPPQTPLRAAQLYVFLNHDVFYRLGLAQVYFHTAGSDGVVGRPVGFPVAIRQVLWPRTAWLFPGKR
jgi:hypothetical protein